MSDTCDVNLLVYASDTASPFHPVAHRVLTEMMTGPGLVYLFWPVLLGYLRIATNPAAAARALAPAVAEANVAALVAQPSVRAVGELDGFWATYRTVADDGRPRGNLVPDAHIVALMLQHGVARIWTHDRDFRKFRGITVRDPFET